MADSGQFWSHPVEIVDGMWLLPSYADSQSVFKEIQSLILQAPLRHMRTRRGFTMSVAMTNCGDLGWVSDRQGYRYSPIDPDSGQLWPKLPTALTKLAHDAAALSGFAHFAPDACLINRYVPGAQMGAHQDRNERDRTQPIVSVSLGIPARFFIVNENTELSSQANKKSIPVDLSDGDVIVFGGAARMCSHGVRKLKPGYHPLWGEARWNLTFRQAG
ncbi:MAG: alpha-ketoglutarate-dependent dioxygenase AlkB [Granulosicoccaceae bacterium]